MSQKNGYDRIAWCYPFLERLMYGRRLHKARLSLAKPLTKVNRILLLGEGNGQFLLWLLKHNPQAHITVLDSSPKMLDSARNRIDQHLPDALPRVSFIQKDVLQWHPEPASPFDALACHYFLDQFTDDELHPLCEKLATATRPGGILHLVDFRVPKRGKQRKRAQLRLSFLYRAFQCVCDFPATSWHDPAPHMQAAGFTRGTSHLALNGGLESTSWHREHSASI